MSISERSQKLILMGGVVTGGYLLGQNTFNHFQKDGRPSFWIPVGATMAGAYVGGMATMAAMMLTGVHSLERRTP